MTRRRHAGEPGLPHGRYQPARALDVDENHRQRVLAVLSTLKVPAHWVKMVEEVSELEREEQGQMLGDSLPIGLRLLEPRE